MVFEAVASDGKVIPTRFIEVGREINTAKYLKIVREVLLSFTLD